MKLALTLAGVLVALLAAVTYAALETGGVGLVETEKADGILAISTAQSIPACAVLEKSVAARMV